MKVDIVKFFVNLYIKNKQPHKLEGPLPAEQFQTILCMSTTAIGDTLFFTPLYRAIKQKYPKKRIIALLNPKNVTLFQNNPYIDQIYTWQGKWVDFFNTVRKLRKEHIDITLIFHSNEPQATPLAVMSGAKYVISIPNHKNSLRHFHSNHPMGLSADKHITFDRFKQLKYLGIKANNPRMDLFLEQKWKDEVRTFLHKNSVVSPETIFIGLQLGASGPERMWQIERWVELGKKIIHELPEAVIVLTGAPNEKKLTARVAEALKSKKVIDVAGFFPLGGAAALIASLNVLVTPDTGPLQIATATKTPTVSFFVLANPLKTHPCYDSDIHLCIRKPITCDPCLKKKCKYAKCMLQITADEAFAAICMLLGKNKIDNNLLVKNT